MVITTEDIDEVPEELIECLETLDDLRLSITDMCHRSDASGKAMLLMSKLLADHSRWELKANGYIREREVIFEGQHGKVKL